MGIRMAALRAIDSSTDLVAKASKSLASSKPKAFPVFP